MSSNIKNVLIFAVGAIVGSAVTFKLIKDRYEKIAQDEIDSVIEVFTKKQSKPEDGPDIDTDDMEESKEDIATKNKQKTEKNPDISLYNSKVKTLGYTNYSEVTKNEDKKDKQEPVEKPYVISPEEFGEFEDYEQISLTYYSDEVLVDENDELVEDVDDVVGLDSLTRFGEYEEDSVFVRNDKFRCDYEILLDERTYADVMKKYPHR